MSNLIQVLIFLAITFSKCKSSVEENFVVSSENCEWLSRERDEINELCKNEFVSSLLDSFKTSLYVNNYKTILRVPGSKNDSVSIFGLRAIPYIIATPRDDFSTYDIIYGFTNKDCSEYYDRLIKSRRSIIHGIRFSISEKRVICYLSSDGKLLLDSNFMKIDSQINQPEFRMIIERHKHQITDKSLKAFVR